MVNLLFNQKDCIPININHSLVIEVKYRFEAIQNYYSTEKQIRNKGLKM